VSDLREGEVSFINILRDIHFMVNLKYTIITAWTVGNVGTSITSNVAARRIRIGRNAVTSLSHVHVYMRYNTVTSFSEGMDKKFVEEKEFFSFCRTHGYQGFP
jgi:hypothetical protein